MRKLFQPALLVALAVLFFSGAGNTAPLAPGSVAPAFALRDTNGRTWQLTKLRGKVVLLDFGSVACLPCQSALVELQRLQDQYGKQGLQVLAVNMDGPMAYLVPRFRAEQRLTYPFLLDKTGIVPNRYRVPGIPFLVLIGRDGRVRATHQGFERGAHARLSRAVSAALAPAAAHGKR